MNRFKGTPAPWKLAPMGPNGCPIIGSGITMVAMLAHSVNEGDQADEARANAHLIASAPELLEVLIEIRKLVAYHDKADLVIAKALGKVK